MQPIAIDHAFKEAGLRLDDIDAIAYTRGPGMTGCLSICATSAKALAGASGKPVIGLHHMVRTLTHWLYYDWLAHALQLITRHVSSKLMHSHRSLPKSSRQNSHS